MRGRRSLLVVALALVAMLTVTSAVYGASKFFVKGGAVTTAGAKKAAPGTTHNCNVKKGSEADGTNTGVSTTSTTYVDVQDMSVTFNVKASGCALVSFAAFAFAPGSGLEFVQAVSNNVACNPGEMQFTGNDETFAVSHAANFECAVALGSNTVKIQFRSFDGASVFIHRRAMFVWHGP
jgi:hypothetical protein